MNETLGFIGLGHMGTPMAANLLRAGYHLRIYDTDPVRAQQLAQHFEYAIPVKSASAVVESGGIVLSMTPDDEALYDIAYRADIIHQIGPAGIHLSLATTTPAFSSRLASQYAQAGSYFLAATVSGRPDVATAAKLLIYLSGNAEAKERVRPLLSLLGEQIYDLGSGTEAATVMKLAVNSLILAALTAMGTAAFFVERHGIPRDVFLRAMRESVLFRGSVVYGEYGSMIAARNYQDEQFSVDLGLKDAQLVVQEGLRCGMRVPAAKQAYEALLAAQLAGHSEQSWAMLAEYVERDDDSMGDEV